MTADNLSGLTGIGEWWWDDGAPTLRAVRLLVRGAANYTPRKDSRQPFPVELHIFTLFLRSGGDLLAWPSYPEAVYPDDLASAVQSLSELSELGLRWKECLIRTNDATYRLRPWTEGEAPILERE